MKMLALKEFVATMSAVENFAVKALVIEGSLVEKAVEMHQRFSEEAVVKDFSATKRLE